MKKKFEVKGIQGSRLDGGCYIVDRSNWEGETYLHRDGTIHKTCGAGNFWETRLAAQKFLDEWEEKQNKTTLREDIETAEALVGETIRSFSAPQSFGKVEYFKILTSLDREAIPTESCVKDFNLKVKENGAAVVLFGNWGGRSRRMFRVVGVNKIETKSHETVSINGWSAKKIATGYKFGCAEITNELLLKAKELLEYSLNGDKSNKKITSITIGEGNFSLDDLKKLV